MQNWSQGFEIVYKKFCRLLMERDVAAHEISQRGLAVFLGISQGKLTAWKAGQWPAAQDLATIAQKLNFSYRWLVTGEGDPEGADDLPGGANQNFTAAPAAHQAEQLAALEAEVARLREALAAETQRRRQAESAAEEAKDELLDMYREAVGRPRHKPRRNAVEEHLSELRENTADYAHSKGFLQEK